MYVRNGHFVLRTAQAQQVTGLVARRKRSIRSGERFSQFAHQLCGVCSDISTGQVQVILKSDTGMATMIDSRVEAGLLLRTKGTDKPVKTSQVAGKKGVQIGGGATENRPSIGPAQKAHSDAKMG